MLTPGGATVSAQSALGKAHTGAEQYKLQVAASPWVHDSLPMGTAGAGGQARAVGRLEVRETALPPQLELPKLHFPGPCSAG